MSNFYKQSNDVFVAEDNINTVEQIEKEISFAGNNQHGKGVKFYTEVEMYNELGELIEKGHNELLLSGGLFTLSKIAGVDIPLKIKTINQDLGINVNETVESFHGLRRDDIIRGFMIGLDGCTDTFDTVQPVYTKQRRITSLIPFRMVEQAEDLEPSERGKYKLKVSEDGYFKYYAKGFETEPVIKVEFDEVGSPSVPSNVDESTSKSPINTYLQFVLKINLNDVREFFKLIGGGLRKARVNTLGLITGYPNDDGDLKGCHLFSKINFNNEPFDNNTKELTVIYKIYI